jgi:hypothetical protein
MFGLSAAESSSSPETAVSTARTLSSNLIRGHPLEFSGKRVRESS